MNKIFNSFGYALNGLKITWQEEQNFRIEVFVGAIVAFCMFYFDFFFIEKLFCIIAIVMVLAAEILNTVIEDVCNKIQPEQDPVIKKIKDISSAFVFVSGAGAFLIGVIVFYYHFA